jgi:hypothetical protein
MVADKANGKRNAKTASDRPAEIPTREQLIAQSNADLSREYQAVIAYVIHSRTLKVRRTWPWPGSLNSTPPGGMPNAQCPNNRMTK